MRARLGLLLVLAGLLLAAGAIVGVLLGQREGVGVRPEPPAERDSTGVDPSRVAPAAVTTEAEVERAPSATPDEARREVDVDGIVGFVRALEGGAPIAGAWVELMGPPRTGRPPEDPRIHDEAGTDASGRFVLPWPDEPGSWVRVTPPPGWARTEPWWRLAPAAHGGAPLEFRLRPRRRAPMEIVLTDIRTREPVPHYVLRVRSLETDETHDLRTDEHGRGRSELELMEGAWEPTLLDDPRMADRASKLSRALAFEALPGGGPLELRIPFGPTWLLDLRGPPGLDPDRLTAFLRSSADPDPPLFTYAPAPVRSTPRSGWPWVRFHGPPMDWWMQAEVPLVLVVVDEEGTLRGEAPVPSEWGVHGDPVRIELRRTGALGLEVVDGAGRPVEQAGVTLRRLADGLETLASTDAQGRAWLEGLPEDEYVLRVVHNRHEPLELPVQVLPGEATRRIVLRPAATGGAVEGVVVGGANLRNWASRGFHMSVSLRSNDGGGRSYRQRLAPEERGGALVAPFRFDDVPDGEYHLTLVFADPLLWWPHELIVRPPATGLELREWAPGTLLDLHLEATDEVTGEGLPAAQVWLAGEAGQPPVPGRHGSDAAIVIPRGVPFTWGLGAPGHRPRFGDAGDLAEGDGELFAVVELERGLGLRVDVRGPDGHPLPDAAILADGAVRGTTGPDGSCLLLLDATPTSLEVRSGEWGASGDLLEALLQGWPACVVRLGDR